MFCSSFVRVYTSTLQVVELLLYVRHRGVSIYIVDEWIGIAVQYRLYQLVFLYVRVFTVGRLLGREPLCIMTLLMTTFGEKSIVDCEMGVGRKAGERFGGYNVEYIVLYCSCLFYFFARLCGDWLKIVGGLSGLL